MITNAIFVIVLLSCHSIGITAYKMPASHHSNRYPLSYYFGSRTKSLITRTQDKVDISSEYNTEIIIPPSNSAISNTRDETDLTPLDYIICGGTASAIGLS
jgi:hypothetical protein